MMDILTQHFKKEIFQVDTTYNQPGFSDELTIGSGELEERAHQLISRCQQLLDQIKEKTDKIKLQIAGR